MSMMEEQPSIEELTNDNDPLKDGTKQRKGDNQEEKKEEKNDESKKEK